MTLQRKRRLVFRALDAARAYQIFSLSAAVSVLEDCVRNLAKGTSYGK